MMDPCRERRNHIPHSWSHLTGFPGRLVKAPAFVLMFVELWLLWVRSPSGAWTPCSAFSKSSLSYPCDSEVRRWGIAVIRDIGCDQDRA
jgi:hypothetical protein